MEHVPVRLKVNTVNESRRYSGDVQWFIKEIVIGIVL